MMIKDICTVSLLLRMGMFSPVDKKSIEGGLFVVDVFFHVENFCCSTFVSLFLKVPSPGFGKYFVITNT